MRIETNPHSAAGACQDAASYTIRETTHDIETMLATTIAAHQNGIALVTLQFHFTGHHLLTDQRVQSSLDNYLTHLRTHIRKSDQMLVMLRNYAHVYILLPGATIEGAETVYKRLWEELLWQVHAAPDEGLIQPDKLVSGYGTYADSASDINECLRAASEPRIHFAVTQDKENDDQIDNSETSTKDLSSQARKLGIPYLSLLPRRLPKNIRRIIDPQLARELLCYPLGKEHNTLTVALADPTDRHALDRLEKETGLAIFPILAHPQELSTAIEDVM